MRAASLATTKKGQMDHLSRTLGHSVSGYGTRVSEQQSSSSGKNGELMVKEVEKRQASSAK